MLGDDVDVIQGTFQENDIKDGATVHVWMGVPKLETREQVQALVDEIIRCNLGQDRAKLMKGAKFDNNGKLQDW